MDHNQSNNTPAKRSPKVQKLLDTPPVAIIRWGTIIIICLYALVVLLMEMQVEWRVRRIVNYLFF